jgi:uncharacterized protein YjbJ (UPF0337 family)
MLTQPSFGVDWNDLSERVKRRWGLLTDADLEQADGNVQKLIGIVQLKTGRAREEVEHFLEQAIQDATSGAGRVATAASQYATDARDTIHRGYGSAEEMVRRKPITSVFIGLGAGLMLGALVGCLLRRE